MGLSQFNFFYKEIVEEERIERLRNKLDIAEAFNFAYIGSQGGNNTYTYESWRESIITQIDPDFLKRQGKMFWNRLAKKSRRIK